MPDSQHTTPTTGYIYLLTNLVNGKRYIGQTFRSLHRRKGDHYRRSRTGKTAINCAVRKYGIDNFSIRALVSISSPDIVDWLNQLEPLFIKSYGSLAPTGYNLDSGGKNYVTHPATRQKLREFNTGKKRGPQSDEHRAKISAANKGKKASPEAIVNMRRASKIRMENPEARQKVSRTLKGRTLPESTRAKMRGHRNAAGNKSRLGQPHSAETKAKIGAANKGNQWNKGRKHSAESLAKMSEARREFHRKRKLREQSQRRHTLSPGSLFTEDNN